MKQFAPLFHLCAFAALVLTFSAVRADDDPKPAPRDSEPSLLSGCAPVKYTPADRAWSPGPSPLARPLS